MGTALSRLPGRVVAAARALRHRRADRGRVSGRHYPIILFLFAAGLALSPPAKADPSGPALIDGGRFGQVQEYRPPSGQAVVGLAMLVSDSAGWGDREDGLARHLASEGQTVLGIDYRAYAQNLRAMTGDCVSVNYDFEVLARRVEKDPSFGTYQAPTIVGLGTGAGIAYAAVAEVLPNTFAGGIGMDFTPAFDVGRKLCLPVASAPGQPLRYGPVGGKQTPWMFAPDAAFAPADVQAFLSSMPQAHQIAGGADTAKAIDAAIGEIAELDAAVTPLGELPIVETPPPGGVNGALPVVIFYSGDGGWRDIDRQIGGYLAQNGFLVVGVDSLRYFWRKRDVPTMVADLERLIRHYSARAKGKGFTLIGYSFGADVLPFIVNRLSPAAKSKIRLISLIGVADRASFEIRLEGILGASNTDGPATLPEMARMGDIPVQCVFGASEHDSACLAPELDKVVQRVELTGGHHFGGDYKHIADIVLKAAQSRIGG